MGPWMGIRTTQVVTHLAPYRVHMDSSVDPRPKIERGRRPSVWGSTQVTRDGPEERYLRIPPRPASPSGNPTPVLCAASSTFPPRNHGLVDSLLGDCRVSKGKRSPNPMGRDQLGQYRPLADGRCSQGTCTSHTDRLTLSIRRSFGLGGHRPPLPPAGVAQGKGTDGSVAKNKLRRPEKGGRASRTAMLCSSRVHVSGWERVS